MKISSGILCKKKNHHHPRQFNHSSVVALVAVSCCFFVVLSVSSSSGVTAFQASHISNDRRRRRRQNMVSNHPLAPVSSSSSSSSSLHAVHVNGDTIIIADPQEQQQQQQQQEQQQPSPQPPDFSHWPTAPKKAGFLRRFRDTLGMIRNPDQYILQRSRELNNAQVFEMYQFFQPIVVVGGQAAVQEFITTAESKYDVIYPALPETFLELHTEWGSLNLNAKDVLFQQARAMFGDVLPPKYHVPNLVPQMEAYVDALAERVETNPKDEQVFLLVPELIRLCLNMFATNFSGKALTDQQVQQFIDYNTGLLSLGKNTQGFQKSEAALKELKQEMLSRFQALEFANDDAPGKWFYHAMANREGFPEDRIATAMVLFVWAAFVETASLMINSMALMDKYDIPVDQVYTEYMNAQQQQESEEGRTEQDAAFWNLPYTTGILRETLRLEPPGAGVQRYSEQDFPLAGYRIPARIPVVMDPRLGNTDPNLFTEPQQFQPLRWVPKSKNKGTNNDNKGPSTSTSTSKCPFAGTAMKLGPGSWFPGGNGAHKCPGVPLAEVTATMFLSKMAQRFSNWKASGSGMTAEGNIKYVPIPIKICPDDFGLVLTLRTEEQRKSGMSADAVVEEKEACMASP